MIEYNLRQVRIMLTNQQITFLIDNQNDDEAVTPCMDVYKAKIQPDLFADEIPE